LKAKVQKDKNGRELLKVSLSKKDVLDYAMASHLAGTTRPYLLPFSFSGKDHQPNFYYDLSHCIPLRTLLQTKITSQQFESIIAQVVSVLDAVASSNLQERNLLLDSNYVFVAAEDTRLKLAYLPLTARVADDKAALRLLHVLADKASFITDEAAEHANDFLDFLRQLSVFSAIELQAFFEQHGISQALQYGNHELEAPVVSSTSSTTSASHTSSLPFAPRKAPGRDFVSARSGKLSTSQTTSLRSTSENIIAAVSEDFNAPEELKGTELLVEDNTPISPPSINPSLCAWLIRASDNKKWEIPKGSAVIGRSKTSTIQVSDSHLVSRQHALLTWNGRELSVLDNDSGNGTKVDGHTLNAQTDTPLQNASILTLGKVDFFVEIKSRFQA